MKAGANIVPCQYFRLFFMLIRIRLKYAGFLMLTLGLKYAGFLMLTLGKGSKKNVENSTFGWVGCFRMGTKSTKKNHAFKIHFRPF